MNYCVNLFIKGIYWEIFLSAFYTNIFFIYKNSIYVNYYVV